MIQYTQFIEIVNFFFSWWFLHSFKTCFVVFTIEWNIYKNKIDCSLKILRMIRCSCEKLWDWSCQPWERNDLRFKLFLLRFSLSLSLSSFFAKHQNYTFYLRNVELWMCFLGLNLLKTSIWVFCFLLLFCVSPRWLCLDVDWSNSFSMKCSARFMCGCLSVTLDVFLFWADVYGVHNQCSEIIWPLFI